VGEEVQRKWLLAVVGSLPASGASEERLHGSDTTHLDTEAAHDDVAADRQQMGADEGLVPHGDDAFISLNGFMHVSGGSG
jgi:hypothetical protein